MKGVQVALDEYAGRKAAALLRDGVLDDLLIDPPEATIRSGAVYRARVGRPVKGIGGAFVDLGGSNGFLKQAKGIAPGRMVTVQVTGYAEPGKAVPVTPRFLFKSRYCIATPGAPGVNISRAISDDAERVRLREILAEASVAEQMGLILRTGCLGADDDAIAGDVAATLALAEQVAADRADTPELLVDGPDAHDLAWRDWGAVGPSDVLSGSGTFAELGIEDEIAALAGPVVRLANGGHLSVEPTRALVSVDVNSGPAMEPAAGLKTNLAAARMLPRSLRLRGLGGQIVVDFAPMAKKDRRQVESALKAAFRADPVETALVGWTQLGLFEIQRKRERLPVAEAIL